MHTSFVRYSYIHAHIITFSVADDDCAKRFCNTRAIARLSNSQIRFCFSLSHTHTQASARTQSRRKIATTTKTFLPFISLSRDFCVWITRVFLVNIHNNTTRTEEKYDQQQQKNSIFFSCCWTGCHQFQYDSDPCLAWFL